MNETLIFFKISSLELNKLIPVSSSLVEAPQNSSFDIVWSWTNIFCYCASSNPTHEMNLEFKKKENDAMN